jgi:hypothetical protein
MIDGDTKGLVIATIVRETRLNAAQAEVVFQQLESTLNLSRRLVEEAFRNAGSNSQAAAYALHARFANVPTPGQSFIIVNRPTSISICAILLFMSVALSAVFLLGNFEGALQVKKLMGTAGIIGSLGFTLVCGWGYWNMKRWAVLLYAVEPILRFVLGVPHALIALPLLIVAIGFINFGEMTWK